MARRRVLAMGPAMTRMIFVRHPYQQMQGACEAKPKRTWTWRWKKAGGEAPRGRRRGWGMRLGRLRIRALIKTLADSYVKMMFSLEAKVGGAAIQCATGPGLIPRHPLQMPARMQAVSRKIVVR